MSIDEAIKRHKENYEMRSKMCIMDDIDKYIIECDKQYAEWLEELKELRKFKNDFTDLGKLYSEIRLEERNKAIDDFVKFASEMPTVENEYGEIRPMWLEEMAEQLKGGVEK